MGLLEPHERHRRRLRQAALSGFTLNRKIRWRPLDESGLEHFTILGWDTAVLARSALVTPTGGCFYEFTLDPDWTVRSLVVQSASGLMLTLGSDRNGTWTEAGIERPDLSGCIDIDISGSPSTNTLPIRRVTDWTVGEPRQFDMAWVDLDAMTVHRDAQIYTRLAPDRFRYQSGDGTFEADLTLDPDGFVLDYPGLFTRA